MNGKIITSLRTIVAVTLYMAFAFKVDATVVVTPATNGSCLNVTPGVYSTLGNIVITEGVSSDIPNQTNTTFILTAPTNFEFQAGTGTVSYIAGRNISSATIVVSSTTITITLSSNQTNRWDVLTISGINARALVAGASGNILRLTGSGGTATIVGDAAGGGINHAALTASGVGTIITSFQAGNWSSPATWIGGMIPTCGANVTINHTVTADITSTVPNLIINTGGDLIATNSIAVSTSLTINGTGTYTHSNNTDASTGIFAGTETLASTSNLVFNSWYNNNVPLGSLLSSNTGNITFGTTGTWDQDGTFSPSKIQGNITVTSGTIDMDDGTGGTTTLNLQDVTISNSGNLFIATGTNRNLTLTTGNYTDNSTGGGISSIMYNVAGDLDWTITGNLAIADDWSVMQNTGTPNGSVVINISGNLGITDGDVTFVETTNAQLDLDVTGDITISGTPGTIIFMDGGSSDMAIDCDNFSVTAGIDNTLMGGSSNGDATLNVSTDMDITGSGVTLHGVDNNSYISNIDFNIGRDLLITDGEFYVANTNSDVDIEVSRNLTLTGANSYFTAQEDGNNEEATGIFINGSLTINDGTFFHSEGKGIITLSVAENFVINNGNFYGVSKSTGPHNNATGTFSMENFIFNGGEAIFVDTKTTSASNIAINCNNNFDINFQANTDIITLIDYQGNNNAKLDLNIRGNFDVSGNYPNAAFLSSRSDGNETVDIGGNFIVSGGLVNFVNTVGGLGTGNHDIIMNIGGYIFISGGTTYLSTRDGDADINVTGNSTITAGTLNVKHQAGTATMDIGGNYRQVGGYFNMHSSTTATNDTVTVTVEGTFVHARSPLNFDNASGNAMAEHKFILNGSSYTVFGTGSITHANNLTANTVFGQFIFNRAGTTTYNRFSNAHRIEHVKIYIRSQTTVDATATGYGFMITSHSSNNTVTHNTLLVHGTLDMGVKVIFGRQQAGYYARFTVYDDGRLRTSHASGLFSGTYAASTINTFILGVAALNYDLEPNSIVEIYGTTTDIVTGIPNGIATGTNQEYGILEINHTGTPGSTWVYPQTTGEVFIRTELRLTSGEFNLDNDHTTNTGGRIINIRNGATITRASGFIRSETEDGSGTVQWDISANGSYTFPFGYDAANYIPFIFQQTSGTTGILALSTYRTNVSNIPYPPTVTHTRDVFGVENSANTVDRFWKIEPTGSSTAGMRFTYVPSEGTGIAFPRAQRWEPITMGWFPPAGIQSNPSGNSTLAMGISSFNSWWTLSALGSPLPVSLVEFTAYKEEKHIKLDWTTLSEVNNERFEIEKSKDGFNFNFIGSIAGHGTTSIPINYSMKDHEPFQGRNYYRLKQVDYDGKFVYSDIVLVNFRNSSSPMAFPNPVLKGTIINIDIQGQAGGTIYIMDSIGKLVSRFFNDRSWDGKIETYNWSQGVYFLHLIDSNGESRKEKIIIQ